MWIMFAAIIIQTGGQPVRLTTADAITSPAAWIATEDYPAEALLAREQGAVMIALGVGTDGRVTDCAIRASSGSKSLDAATCSLLVLRAQFKQGKPGTFVSRIVWTLPDPGEPQVVDVEANTGRMRTYKAELEVGADGVVKSCTILEGDANDPDTPCARTPVGSRAPVRYVRSGKPVSASISMESNVIFEFGAVEPTP